MPNEAQKGTTYHIENMRVVEPVGKVAQRNPDRVMTVHGDFFADKNGKKSGEKLSFSQKAIDRETALDPVFDISLENGTLTLPAGERGRKASEGITSDALATLLEGLRNPVTETEAQAAAAAE